MFGMGKRMSNEEKEKMYEQELKSLKSDERVLKSKDAVYMKRKELKNIKSKPRKEAFKKIGNALRPALQQMKENQERNRKMGSIFDPIQPGSKSKKSKKQQGGFFQ